MWGFLAVSWFLPWPSPRKREETWAFPNCSPSVCQKNPRPTETNWGQLTARLWANCNHYTGHRKFLQIVEKYRHKRISHLTLKSLAWDHNKNVPKDRRDLSHCSTQHSTQGLMTEGVAVVILLLWVPPQLPSNRLSAALPNPGRGGKAQRGMFVARLSPISQNENNDWLFLWGSLEKISCMIGWDEERIADGILQRCIMSVTFHPSGLNLKIQKTPGARALEKVTGGPNHFFPQWVRHNHHLWVHVARKVPGLSSTPKMWPVDPTWSRKPRSEL